MTLKNNYAFEADEALNRDLEPLPCYTRRDLVDHLNRDEFMEAISAHLWNMLTLHTGRTWSGKMHEKSGSWIFYDSDANFLQIRYREKRADMLGEMSVSLRMSSDEAKAMTQDHPADPTSESSFEWWVEKFDHRVMWDVINWADAVDVEMSAIDYPSHLPVPRGTYALMASLRGMIQPMTPAQAGWAARALGQLASVLLLLKREGQDKLVRSAEYQSSAIGKIMPTQPCFLTVSVTDKGIVLFPDIFDPWPWIKWSRGNDSFPFLADEIGPYYYDESNFPERTYTAKQPWTHCLPSGVMRY